MESDKRLNESQSDSNINRRLKVTQFTIQEIWDAMKPKVQRNKKKYTRKDKHKKSGGERY